MVQAVGGLLVAFVAKYANMILKNFACTLSIVFSTVIVAVYFPTHSALSLQFILGAVMVCGATYGYGTADVKVVVKHEEQVLLNILGLTYSPACHPNIDAYARFLW